MSLIRKHVAVLQAWACYCTAITTLSSVMPVSAYMALAFVFGFIQIN